MVFGPAASTWPRVLWKKRATSALYSGSRFPSHGNFPSKPIWPERPMAQITLIVAIAIVSPCARILLTTEQIGSGTS
jgi:hypothetical protein